MPTKSWGNSVGSGSGATLTLLYDRIEVRGDGTGVLVNPRVQFYSRSGWSDSTNNIYAGGSAVADGRIHSGTLNGGTREWWVGVDAVPLAYGSTVWATFDVQVFGVSFFNGDQNTTTYSWPIEFPPRPYSSPRPASNFKNTYVNDNRVDLSWNTNYDGGNGAQPWHGQVINRTNTGDWGGAVDVASFGWDPANLADTTVVPNSRYDYRHRAWNPAGSSPYAYAPNAVYTTPAAPSQVTAAKAANGSIKIEAVNNAPWAAKFEIQDSPDGSTWTNLSTSLSGPTHEHLSPSVTVTHRYRMRAVTPDGKASAWSPVSNVVALQAPPNAPTWKSLDPAYDATRPIVAAFTHNPVDTTPQTAYEMQWRRSLDNGATWNAWASSGKVTSATSARTYAAGAFPQNALVELQVRTWGAHATASPWSASGSLRTSARPTVGISAPVVGSVLPAASLTVKINYADAEGSSQSALEVALFDTPTGAELGRWQESGAVTVFAVPYRLADHGSYRVEVRVRDGASLWSDAALSTFTVSYVPPPAPEPTISWDRAAGSAIITIGNPRPVAGSGAPEPVFNRIFRDGVLVADNVPLNATVVDPLPLIAGSTYLVEAVSALPSEAESEVFLAPDEEVYRRFWFNAGPGWGLVASFRGSPKRGQTRGRKRVVEYYSGRDLPVSTIGEGRVSELSASGLLLLKEGDSFDAFFRVADAPTDACYRDRYGKWFVSLDAIPIEGDNDAIASVKVSMTEVGSRD